MFVSVGGPTGAIGPEGPKGDKGLNWKGAWSGTITYAVDDVVEHNGSSYICILAHINRQPPNSTYWNLFTSGGGADGYKYYNRDDPSNWDFTLSNFICDDVWRDLDLSSIVPAGARAVALSYHVKSSSSNRYILFRKNDNVNNYNYIGIRTQVAALFISSYGIVACDTNRKIEYKIQDTSFSDILVVVAGWFL